jgi:hypothetical protein
MQKSRRAICNEISCSLGRATIALSIFSVGVLLISAAVSAQPRSCFDQVTLEPSLIAFTTNRDSDLADWYQRIFGLKITKEFSFPDGSVTGTLMHKDEFVLEIFNRDDIFEGLDYVPGASSEQWRGVMHLGSTQMQISLP